MSELENLNLPELLDRLVDITEPVPVSYLPQTTAWIYLALFLLLVFLAAAWQFWRRWEANRYRRDALMALAAIEAEGYTGERLAAEISSLLRCTALAAFPREEVASLIGADWLAFLDRHSREQHFTEGAGKSLATAPYKGGSDALSEPRDALVSAARAWIERHEPKIPHA